MNLYCSCSQWLNLNDTESKKKKKISTKKMGYILVCSVLCGSFMSTGIKPPQGELISHTSLLQMPPVPG